MFMKADGHKMRFGFKVVSTSVWTIIKHNFTPEKINYPDFVAQRIDGTNVEGLKSFKEYCRMNGLDKTPCHT